MPCLYSYTAKMNSYYNKLISTIKLIPANITVYTDTSSEEDGSLIYLQISNEPALNSRAVHNCARRAVRVHWL